MNFACLEFSVRRIFRHQNSVLAALPVGQVVLSVRRAAKDFSVFANRDKKELTQTPQP